MSGVDWPSRFRSSLVLIAAFLSVTSLVFELSLGRGITRYLDANQVSFGLRNAALVALITVGVVASACAVVLAVRRPLVLDLAARRVAFALPLFVLPLLFNRKPWEGKELALLVFLAGWGLLEEALLGVSLRALPLAWLSRVVSRVPVSLRRALPLLLVVAAAVGYAVRTSELVLLNHERLATSSSDLAEFDNLFFNALHGHPFRSPAILGELGNWTALKIHAEFLLYLLLPIYALHPGPETLLVVQTCVIAATALPIYLLGAERLGRGLGVAVAVAFLLCPAVQRPNFYDYHFTPLGMHWAAWWLYFLSRAVRVSKGGVRVGSIRVMGPLVASAALTMLAREDISLGFGIAALLLALFGVLPRVTASIGVVACVYFGVIKFGVMAHIGPTWFDSIYDKLKAEGAKGFHAIFVTLVTNPAFSLGTLLTEPKLLYLLHMTVPVLFLWWRSPALVLAMVPGILFTLMVTNRPPMFESSFQYTYHWIAYVFGASVLGIEAVSARRGRAAGAAAGTALVVVALVANFQLGALLGGKRILGGFGWKALEVTEVERSRYRDLEKLTKMIPPTASVAATEAEGPHVSTRLVVYSLKMTLGRDPDYVLFGRLGIPGEAQNVRLALGTNRYDVLARSGDFTLLRRGPATPANAGVARTLGL
jgi:uncharacterized membrane protein